MKNSSRRSPRNTAQDQSPSYPIPAYLDFVPGGIDYGSEKDPATLSQKRNRYMLCLIQPDSLVNKAYTSDRILRKYAIRYAYQNATKTGDNKEPFDVPYRLPSLSILAEAVFGPLTGVPATSVRKWADAMVLSYFEQDLETDVSKSLDDILAADDVELLTEFQRQMDSAPPLSPSSMKASSAPSSPTHIHSSNDLVTALKSLHQKQMEANVSNNNPKSPLPVRPCGYVFQRNDIAWNCRTCQTDSTCVLCESCYQNSDHEGHDVYFHRTSPGGCCDCGDAEAWRVEGCCSLHRPRDMNSNDFNSDTCMEIDATKSEDVDMSSIGVSYSGLSEENKSDFEAVRASMKGRADGELCVKEMLPPRLAAAMAVVIGAAVQTSIQAIDGAAIGADPVQWTRRWADQIRKIRDGHAFDEECVLSANRSCANTIGDAMNLEFPKKFKLQLRLHNDDVHTYDEVIEALHQRRRIYGAPTHPKDGNPETDVTNGIISTLDQAKDLTTHVDTDGQVIARGYSTMEGAKAGFGRLKSSGLHCAIVSTPQMDLELRARVLLSWLSEVSAAHPAVAALVVHAFVDVTEGSDPLGGAYVWPHSRMIPPWSFSHGYFSSTRVAINEEDDDDVNYVPGWRQRMEVFPPNLHSSYLTREEARQLHKLGLSAPIEVSSPKKGVDLNFYSRVPYILPSERFKKSPHSLWGIMPSPFTTPKKYDHPFLYRDNVNSEQSYHLLDSLIVLETDLRKQQEPDTLIHDGYTHDLLGLYMISGVGLVDVDGDEHGGSAVKPTAEDWRQLLSISSYRAPVSPILLMLLLDPYPPKQLRASIHPLFLSLLVDSRMKSRFAASLGAIAYRSLTTLFCAGVGTEVDSPLTFTVQIFTTGSLVRALCNVDATRKLLGFDGVLNAGDENGFQDVFTLPIAHNIVRCIHTNLLGACKEVKMVLKNTVTDVGSHEKRKRNYVSALTYQHGESPHTTLLPAAPDDEFLDARSTKHKRLPPIIRDLEYVFETPGTALRLLVNGNGGSSFLESNIPQFPTMWSRLLRLAQGVDTQKRKISGGHVEYEQIRWLEAYSLSLHFAGACSKLAESQPNTAPNVEPASYEAMRKGMGNLFSALLCEIKWWLYNEFILDSGLPRSSRETNRLEALQRSTLHLSMSNLGVASASSDDGGKATALSCASYTKMTEVNLEMIENAIRIEQSQYQLNGAGRGMIMGDWLRVPHSPHAGDSLSFHLPLHRALARNIRSICSQTVPQELRERKSLWWLLPTIDAELCPEQSFSSESLEHPLSTLLRPALRASNCRVTWAAGPDCNSNEAHRRRSRSRAVSAAITAAKVIHSLCDHPLRCLAASEQITRHLWARNGSTAVGMAMNYSQPPLCQTFKDLDMTMVQLSASGLSIGLGARRVFSLLLSRFDLDGFLCDPERKQGNRSPTGANMISSWVSPPIMQDPDHAPALAEALFSTLCILVTELPPPPPKSSSDNSSIRIHIRRGLIHALAVQPLTNSKAMEAASMAVTLKDSTGADIDEAGISSFRSLCEEVLREISSQKSQGSRSIAPPCFQLNCGVSDEYDPSFFHLKRADHQQAMDNIARLRKQKLSSKAKRSKKKCLPLVAPPPSAHPRFLPCRMLLHISALDAAIRRSLMFALTGGEWLPPRDPTDFMDDLTLENSTISFDLSTSDGKTVKSAGRRSARMDKINKKTQFSAEVVNNSSVSYLEVLQLLTLQVHTLESCANMHQSYPNLDSETKSLSSMMSINSYLGRMVHVPSSLVDVWAFRVYPDGPLNSSGSGLNRGSILGMLIALYEHKSDNAAMSGDDTGHGEEGLGGARFLVASGLKWLLRFVNALVDGAQTVGIACQCASDGIPITEMNEQNKVNTSWTIDSHLQSTVSGMLDNLPDLWPSDDSEASENVEAVSNDKNREAMKAAQTRVLERMKKQQESFAASIASEGKVALQGDKDVNEEADLCIICRCDDDDGENNGPLGYLGHVQRSRAMQLRSQGQSLECNNNVAATYRVVGDMGCQIRAHKNMDSAPVTCIPVGSLVTVLKSKVNPNYGLKSRRVLVRYRSPSNTKVFEGWASVQSAQGYTILSPLVDICYNHSRWGGTRPFIRQCGHAAHLACVDAHVASIHQKAQTDTPFDGRFAAEIEDGEFLCPLCKQLSNVVVPTEEYQKKMNQDDDITIEKSRSQQITSTSDKIRFELLRDSIVEGVESTNNMIEKKKRAIKQYGTYLLNAMQVSSGDKHKSKVMKKWHPAVKQWDFKDNEDSLAENGNLSVGDILPLLRQQHIAWSAAGHGAAAAEASTRGIRQLGFDPPTSDPWSDFNTETRDTHPMLLELRRTLTAAASLYEVLSLEMNEKLSMDKNNTSLDEAVEHEKGCNGVSTPPSTSTTSVVGCLLANIINGTFWTSFADSTNQDEWSVLTSFLASMPCHVSRDDTLGLRHEARATAAQIWAVKGLGVDTSTNSLASKLPIDQANTIKDGSTNNLYPPPPKCVRSIPGFKNILGDSWGTMNASDVVKDSTVLFRPAFASGFLYIPLLSWDLNTFAAALFSSLLTSQKLQAETLCDAARVLMLARMIQALITPYGLEKVENCAFECEMDVAEEGAAIVAILNQLKMTLDPVSKSDRRSNEDGQKLLSSVSYAILPFARTLVLLLRAAFSAAKQKFHGTFNSEVVTFIEDEDTMYIEDGFYFMQKLGGPLPSEINKPIISEVDKNDESMFWHNLVQRWVGALLSFEAYHGSEGGLLEFDSERKDWVPVAPSIKQDFSFKSEEDDANEIASGEKGEVIETFNMSTYVVNDNEDANSDFSGSLGDNGDETMEDEVLDIDEVGIARFGIGQIDSALGIDIDDEMDEAGDVDIFGLPSLPSQVSNDEFTSNQLEDDQSIVLSSNNNDGDDDLSEDKMFANVASASIVPFQPSLLGHRRPGPGPRGSTLDYAAASNILCDLSHLGTIHTSSVESSGLIQLPRSYVELYSLVNKVKATVKNTPLDDAEDTESGETAICLMTGAVMRAGQPRRGSRRGYRPPGTCTLHARTVGSGTGIFFLLQKCIVLLVHNKKSSYSASLYVDENGEEDTGLTRGRPLFLKDDRYEALGCLWRQHGVPREVAQIRSTSDRVIRDNWY